MSGGAIVSEPWAPKLSISRSCQHQINQLLVEPTSAAMELAIFGLRWPLARSNPTTVILCLGDLCAQHGR
jgi:hypothetical protein